MDSIIEDIRVRKILDSRGNPTLEVDVITWNGFGRAAAPSGASTGSREVVAFPEGGVDKILGELEDVISTELIGMDAEDLREIDFGSDAAARHVLNYINGERSITRIRDCAAAETGADVSLEAVITYLELLKEVGWIDW